LEVNVIDGIMGVGKTTYAIDMINSSDNINYIYITPFLDECERIREKCSSKSFYEPSVKRGKGSKGRDLKSLIKSGKNIVSTHSLFKNMDNITRELLEEREYILILDEVMDVVEEYKLKKDDYDVFRNEFIDVHPDGTVTWKEEKKNYRGDKFMTEKIMCEHGSFVVIDQTVLMWKFPVEVFKLFKKVYILTYLFDAQIQKYYFDYYNIKYNYKSIDRIDNVYSLVEKGNSKFEKNKIKQVSELIELCPDKYNKIGDEEYSLTVSWFKNEKNYKKITELKKNIFNYFKNQCGTKTNENGWTTFRDYKSDLSGKGYTKGFIPINMRASNDFQNKKSMAYAANRFINPYLVKMFSYKGIKINQDKWALSEMLQWIWRGCIRKNEPMKLYIPSKRMRELFEEWINSEF